MASSSSSSTSNTFPPDPSSSVSCGYNVFLSFRGEDTRKSFVDHLYAALDQRGFYTFKDDERLRAGELIPHKLLEAIEQSGSAVVVFSKNYASSSWCLDELVKIMECKDQMLRRRRAVFPVFYDVDPSEVRSQTGIFGEGFAKAAERKAGKADVWRKALHDAANLSGYDVRNTADGLESLCIKKVVEWCSSHSCNISDIDEDLIGMPSRVRNLMLLLGRDLDDVRMIGIWGMGGAGKTTVADVTFHEVKKQFDGASFIADVREKSKKIDGLQLLQKKILSDILMDEKLEVDSVPEGKRKIKSRLGHKKVLIILDDVDDDEQLRALAGDCKWFGKGSRVLITTRDRHLLEVHGVDKNDIHSVNLLSEDEAILLFNRHAFKKCSPAKEYNELSLRVVRYAAGLPLALTVLGSFLCGRGMTEWTSALKRLEKIPEGKILEKLQISYDGLIQVEKKIFLDIACLFKGWEKDEVIRILDSCEFDPVIGIDVLVQKSLVSLSDDQKFQMHDLLQEMGRNIGRKNRLWRSEDIDDVLQNNTGTEAIEAIVAGPEVPLKCDITKAFGSMKKLRILYKTTWGEDVKCDNTKPFRSMKKLIRILCLNYWHVLFNKHEYLPDDELRWLTWERYPHESLPESFHAPKLVGLEMHASNIVQLWKGNKLLDKLKFLNLGYARKLIRSPDFSGIPNLETLKLNCCSSLIEVHRSIGDLQRLVLLDLSYCENLVKFPSNIQMKSLEILNFTGCWKFKRFPELQGNMDRLSELHLAETAIEGLTSSIANLTKLVLIDLRGCVNLLELPDTICVLKYLKKMNLSVCWKLKKLPENLGFIESLEELDVSRSGIKILPSSIVLLKNLRCLYGCMILVDSISHIESCLKVLNFSFCDLPDRAIPADIRKLSFLEKLDLQMNSFSFVPFIISQLSHLKILDLTWCRELKELPELPSSIAILEAGYCTSLESIEGCLSGKHYKWLWMVGLNGCSSLRMHKKCEQCQQEYSITGRGSEWMTLTPSELDFCQKHRKSLRVSVGDILLQSMLQRQAVVNHRFSICYTEGVDNAIPKWFGQEVKGNRFILKLPPNWQNKITGFAMCVVSDGPFSKISLGISLSEVGWQIPGLDAEFARPNSARSSSTARLFSKLAQRSPAADRYYDVWMGYISLKMLQRSTESVMPWVDWMDTATQFFLTFKTDLRGRYGSDIPIESCAARAVYMEDVEDWEASTAVSSSFSSSSLQQQHDPNFAAKTTLPCSKVPGTANRITLCLETTTHTVISG